MLSKSNPFRSPPEHHKPALSMPVPADLAQAVNPPYPAYIRPLDLQFSDPAGHWYRVYARCPQKQVLSVFSRLERLA